MMNRDDTDSQLMNYVVRMVVPVRREFGRNLNVGQFLHDVAYAREVLDEALGSKDGRLREYATYLQSRMQGPRISAAPAAAAASAQPVAATAEVKPPPAAPAPLTAEEMRARIMKKYTDGLR